MAEANHLIAQCERKKTREQEGGDSAFLGLNPMLNQNDDVINKTKEYLD